MLHTAESAYQSLRQSGYEVRLIYTAPPQGKGPKGEARVVRQRRLGRNRVELVCAFSQSSPQEV